MDIEAYIESGIIESVVLGLAGDQETREVQCMMHIYPEIRDEYLRFAAQLENTLVDNAVAPDPSLKMQLLAQIRAEESPLQVVPAETSEPEIIQMTPQSPNFWKFATAAVAACVIIVGAFWFTANQQTQELSARLAKLENQHDADAQALDALSSAQKTLMATHAVVAHTKTRELELAGMPKAPDAGVKLMYNMDMKKAVMVAETIPTLPADMVYQLWAIKDGKPVSLGLFDNGELADLTEPFSIPDSGISAFAITMEPRGGVAQPTLENLMVMGNMKS